MTPFMQNICKCYQTEKIQEEENIYVDIYPGIDNNEIITLKELLSF